MTVFKQENKMVRVAFVVGDYPSEESTRREQVALSYANSEVEVGIIRAPITPYFYGMTQTEMTLVAPTVIEAFVRAQKEGYHAVVPLGFLDLGVDGGRAAVDIPVIAPFECALHLASLLGDRFGLVCYHENQYGNLYGLLRHYGMERKVVGIESSGFDLPDIAANHDAMVETFLKSARKLINEKGAELIIPTGISQCPVHMNPKWLMAELGVPVVEGIGAPIRLAGLFADLSMNHSRKRWRKSQTYAGK
jgi:allantoin racemase